MRKSKPRRYNYGLKCFLDAKQLNKPEAVNAFLKSENITDFTINDYQKMNNYIENNWSKFCSFIDRSIKNGSIKGVPVKLNTHYDEVRERNAIIKAEFGRLSLSKDELKILQLDGWKFGLIHSLISKSGLSSPQKDRSFTSKRLQNMPLILILRENNLIEKAVELIKERDK